jgi:hypothetical protein
VSRDIARDAPGRKISHTGPASISRTRISAGRNWRRTWRSSGPAGETAGSAALTCAARPAVRLARPPRIARPAPIARPAGKIIYRTTVRLARRDPIPGRFAALVAVSAPWPPGQRHERRRPLAAAGARVTPVARQRACRAPAQRDSAVWSMSARDDAGSSDAPMSIWNAILCR